MLITQRHQLSKISFLHLNVHIKMVTGCDSIEQFLPLQTLGTNKSYIRICLQNIKAEAA